jgi:hypothetical protein
MIREATQARPELERRPAPRSRTRAAVEAEAVEAAETAARVLMIAGEALGE